MRCDHRGLIGGNDLPSLGQVRFPSPNEELLRYGKADLQSHRWELSRRHTVDQSQ